MTDKLYTVVLDFRGGTYIGQVSKESPDKAAEEWAKAVSPDDARAWKLNKGELLKLLRGDKPTALNGCIGVWCFSGEIEGHLALVNVVQTSTDV